uniref:Histone-lysine N-methyltransferase Set2 n=2 Tax=Drosophila melanogaster TaxID=7227 RepID=SET2_DROME|eukprot:NP_001162740.1 SET domain containing 2, isoform B [Drosophila melanogaster]
MEESGPPSNPSPVASRGRGRGRPPKVALSALGNTPPHINPSLKHADAEASPTAPEDQDSGQSECRRSSRKKIIKFDVRDLLNKNRKAHKIQIEARIDSNPSTGHSQSGTTAASTSMSTATASAASASSAATVSRLFSMFEMSHQSLPPPPPPPTALEIFAKPRPTQSLIVAQVTSEPSAVGGAHPVQTMAGLPPVTPRKRGRPRKSQLADAAIIPTVIVPSCSDSDTNSTSTTTSNMSSDSGELPGFPIQKPKSKLRVSLKRLKLGGRLESSDSGNSPSSSSPEVEPPALQDENAMDERPKQEQNLSRMVDAEENSDSDSQIIFIEIETESPKGEEEQEEGRPVEVEPQDLIDIDMELAKQEPTPDPEEDLDEIMVEVLSGPPSLWSADDEAEEEEDATVQRATPPGKEPAADSCSSAPRRSRRSAPLSGSSRQGKTLEETFAEIAAESSKQILEAEESQDQEEQHILIDLIEDTLKSDNIAASLNKDIFEPKVETKATCGEVVPRPEMVTEDVYITEGIAATLEKSAVVTKPTTEMIAETKLSDEVVIEPPLKDESDPKQTEVELPESKPAVNIPKSERILSAEVETTSSPLVPPECCTLESVSGPVLLETSLSTEEKSNENVETTPLKTEAAKEDSPPAAPEEEASNSSEEPNFLLEDYESNQEQVAEDEMMKCNNQKGQKQTPLPEMKEPEKPVAETVSKKEKAMENPARSSPAIVDKKVRAGEMEKKVVKSTKGTVPEKKMDSKKSCAAVTPAKQKESGKSAKEAILKKETEKEKSSAKLDSSSPNTLDKKGKDTAQWSPQLQTLPKSSTKPPQESAPSVISKTTSNQPAPKEEQHAAKKGLSDNSPPSVLKAKEKAVSGFVECDAMFKAMDLANAQLRLDEKNKKKLKKVPTKVEAPPKVEPPTAVPVPGQKKSLSGKTSLRRNTVYEDSPNLERNSSPSSDSAQANTSAGKLKPSKVKKKINPRRSTICEAAKDLRSSSSSSTPTREVAASSPVSTSSDSSSKRNGSKRTTSDLDGGSKLDQRRYTICEDRQPETAIPVPLTKRRFSMHPKASANPLHDTLLQTAGKKRGRKEGKESLSRQNSLDSSSSASQGAPKKKALKSAEILSAALLETESSESTSSGSKMSRWDVQTSPELEAANPFGDIAKFIEDGVNLLKRDKVDEDQRKEGQDEVKREADPEEDEFAQRVANMETPATTPTPSPTQSNPEDSASTTTVLKELETGGGVRRSHRIKQKPQGPRASQGRGVASVALAPISMDEQLAELANIEAINEQFLRSEGLNTFQLLKENFYRCARQVSQENAEMQCDCFLTGDEEAQGHLSCGAGCINRMLMIECGPLCSNGARCTNKRFQQHQCWPCRVFRTEKKGCGITAELLIPPGEFIMEYVGEVIDSEEFERRQHLYSKDRNRHYYFMALRGEAVIDATSKGNISRYINHSCDPNAETQKWTVNGELRIGFFSVKPIQPGEEITFDYQYLRYGRDAQRCYCEAANCRGWIGGEPDSDEGEQLDEESDSDAEMDEEELEAEPEEGQPRKSAKAKAKSKLKAKLPLATGRKRKEQTKPKDREYKAGRWLKPSATGSSSSAEKPPKKPKVNKFQAMLEDPDVVEELSLLRRGGLKNQQDTLRFSRCLVRAKLLKTRLALLRVLTHGELPCRRLFLDYHGLRLLHAWISENGNDDQLREALLDTLESLPIPNRTMLSDSRVYQSVQLWSNSLEQQLAVVPQEKQAALHKRMVALLQKWQALPEIFRIPKRERIEQMKEHEREADRQQKHVHASTALEDQRERESSNDRFRQDRFRRDTTSSRIGKPIRMSGNNTICTITTQQKGSNGAPDGMTRNDNRRRSDIGPPSEQRRTLSKELRRSLFERKVALDEAERRVCTEDRLEHELRCEFFGADINTDPKQLPFYQKTDTNEWFNSDDVPVPAPPRTELLTKALLSPDIDVGQGATDVEYKLPPGVDPLPPAWNWQVTSDGDIYYYNLRERISQWEPPSPEQRLQTLLEENTTQQPLHELQIDPAVLENELIQVDTDYVGSLSAKSLAQYIEAKVRERRDLRRSKLVSIRLISPRRDEDRLYNQLESRKYKENKEKIRRRKELYRRRKIEVLPDAVDEIPVPGKALPIQPYLFSSDEEETKVAAIEQPAAEEEQDSLNMAPSTSHAAMAALGKAVAQPTGLGTVGKRKLPMPPSVTVKKHRQEQRSKKVKSSQSPLTATSAREAHEKFRFEISGHVANFLRPYRKESCTLGRITSDEDYKFLVNRLSYHITTKEMRYCEVSGNPLSCTESVKHKSYDFINQYMRQKGPVYKKPAEND